MPITYTTVYHPVSGSARVVASSVPLWLSRGWSLREPVVVAPPFVLLEAELSTQEGDSTGPPESSQEGTHPAEGVIGHGQVHSE